MPSAGMLSVFESGAYIQHYSWIDLHFRDQLDHVHLKFERVTGHSELNQDFKFNNVSRRQRSKGIILQQFITVLEATAYKYTIYTNSV